LKLCHPGHCRCCVGFENPQHLQQLRIRSITMGSMRRVHSPVGRPHLIGNNIWLCLCVLDLYNFQNTPNPHTNVPAFRLEHLGHGCCLCFHLGSLQHLQQLKVWNIAMRSTWPCALPSGESPFHWEHTRLFSVRGVLVFKATCN
jgi:hypothetical protein